LLRGGHFYHIDQLEYLSILRELFRKKFTKKINFLEKVHKKDYIGFCQAFCDLLVERVFARLFSKKPTGATAFHS
jgi:hypothetical protein